MTPPCPTRRSSDLFSCHGCAKGQNASISHDNPFIVRAGMADQPVGARHSVAYGTEQLDFLAAHHIGMASPDGLIRSEEQTSELQSPLRISYAVFCLTKNNDDHKTMHSTKRT